MKLPLMLCRKFKGFKNIFQCAPCDLKFPRLKITPIKLVRVMAENDDIQYYCKWCEMDFWIKIDIGEYNNYTYYNAYINKNEVIHWAKTKEDAEDGLNEIVSASMYFWGKVIENYKKSLGEA